MTLDGKMMQLLRRSSQPSGIKFKIARTYLRGGQPIAP
jgi:hypothetical protein